MDSDDLIQQYKNAINNKIKLITVNNELSKELDTKIKKRNILLEIISIDRKEPPSMPGTNIPGFPMIVGHSNFRMSIVNPGVLPSPDQSRYWTTTAIFPIGYRAKRKYKPHLQYAKKEKEKIIYYMTVHPDDRFLEIEADDGKIWNGDNAWELFKEQCDGASDYKNIEDFFGFRQQSVIRMIESMGDVSLYSGYVSLSERNGQTNEENK
ncbi:hypothetical protein TCON_1013 [Astathelohania contejeani]|uniref:FYR N-terminal domain-containing protein n=1 Tax=Astathelohania contejeani TaxID=164912 RepID=A0ABQ7I003_9MICR|nr:hypothetical protein TCON_1013 [Thelohania contejeani]